MKNLFTKKRKGPQLKKFAGEGTVLMSSIIEIQTLLEQLETENLINILNGYLDLVLPTIQKHSGVVHRFEADTVLAFWPSSHENPNHAQLAFDASCEILNSLPNTNAQHEDVDYSVAIVLGTGKMSGDFCGPNKQFQLIGNAMAIAERISRLKTITNSSIYFSQHTLHLLKPIPELEEIEVSTKDNLEDLIIFRYSTA